MLFRPRTELIVPDSYNATTSYTKIEANSLLELTAQTVYAQIRLLGANENAYGYILGHLDDNATTNGIRFMVTDSGGPFVSLGASSTGSPGNPSWGGSGMPAMTVGAIQHIAGTWTGSLNCADLNFFQSENGAPLVQYNASGGVSGSGAIQQPTGKALYIGNRGDNARTFNGDIFQVARWNRVLVLDELRRVQRYGPQIVPEGLVLNYFNRRDRGPFRFRTTNSAVGFGGVSRYVAPVYVDSRQVFFPPISEPPAPSASKSYAFVIG